MALPGSPRGGLRRSLGVARGTLRAGWRSAALLVLLGSVGLGTLVSIRSLAAPGHASAPRLGQPAIASVGKAFAATAEWQEPVALQARAIAELYQLLLILGWAALAIAGISILSHLSAQADVRGPEIGVRRAVGASRRAIWMELMFEAGPLLLAMLALGLPLAMTLRSAATSGWPGPVTAGTLVPWGAVVALTALVTFGALTPLRFLASRHMRQPAEGQVLLGIPAFQLAMGLTILLSSAVLLRRGGRLGSEATARETRPGFVLAIDSGRQEPAARAREFEALLRGLARTPGIGLASLASPGELLGLGPVDVLTTDCGKCYRGQILIRWDRLSTGHHLVSPHTFATQGLSVLEGRSFGTEDGFDAPRVALVSRHLAIRGFQAGGPVGRDIYLGDDWPERPYRVIGVVEDRRPPALGGALEPLDTIYLNVLQHPSAATELMVRADRPGVDSSAAMAMVTGLLDRGSRARYLGAPDQLAARAELPIRWFGGWFGLVGLVVLVSAIVGTFTTMRMWVRSSASELAVRRATGATRRRMVAWVLWRTAGTGVKGVLLGLLCFLGAARVSLRALVTDVPVWDPVLFGITAAVLVGAATLGAFLPAVQLLRRPIAAMEGR